MPAAELIGLDAGVLPLDVNQPAVIVGGDAQLQGQGTARCRSASAQFRKDTLEEPARVGNVIHREGRVDDVLVNQAAGSIQESLDDRMIDRGMDRDLRIGTLECFGPHPAQ